MNLRIGDCIERRADALDLVCQIVEVRSTGYTWQYLRRNELSTGDLATGRGRYQSDATDDPFFQKGWSRIDFSAALTELPKSRGRRR
jgi:hypothetical protein